MTRPESGRGWENALADVPLFDGVSKRHLKRIAELGRIVRYERGVTLIRAGTPGDAFYVVLDGTIEIVLGRGIPPVVQGAGASVGEMALLDDAPRSADVIAASDLTCFRLERTAFAKLLRSEPTVTIAIMRTLARRLRAATV